MATEISDEAFRAAFYGRYSPADSGHFERAIDDGAVESWAYCRKNFGASNFATTQGWMRRQFISNRLRSTMFSGNINVQARDYKGHFLLGDERCNNFDLIMSHGDVGLIIYRASYQRQLPRRIPINAFLSSAAHSRQQGLFPRNMLRKINLLRKDLLPADLKALFFVRYWYADDDPTGATIGKIEIIVMDADCRNLSCTVCDLREYAGSAVRNALYEYDQELPMAFRTPETDETEADNLPIKRRDDLEDN